MSLAIPDPSLVLLVGPSGCGKSTFARRRFAETEVVSSDRCRALVADDESDQSASGPAFAVLHAIVAGRLAMRKLVVVDATNLQPNARAPLLELARRHHLPAVAILFDVPVELCLRRAAARAERVVEPAVIERHWQLLADARRMLPNEGVQRMWRLRSEAEIDAAVIAREPLPADRRAEHGPFDLVGDVHGCLDELVELLGVLGYAPDPSPRSGQAAEGTWRHPAGRRVIFLGDLVDRGPAVAAVLRLAMDMVERGTALCIPGNHDDKLMRKLQGRNVRVAHGLQESLDSLAEQPRAFSRRVQRFLAGLPSHLVLDGGRLVAAHGGMRESLQGRESRRVRDFALYGDTTGEADELGLPVRRDWASEYHGQAMVVYGHTPVAHPIWVHGTINVDTGCVFGGRLTALRYPELELVSVPARRRYATSTRPFPPPADVAGDGATPSIATAPG